MPDLKSIIIGTPVEALEDMLSPFIEEQFPSFMRSDYRKLILFIKAYYEWMEKEGNPSFILSKLDDIMDVDKNSEQFYSYFKKMYLDSFPDLLATTVDGNTPNKKTLLKRIRNFYGTKGTDSAYKFLFRVLYDSDVQLYYPKKDILRASDGVWVEEISIKVTRGENEQYHYSMIGGSVQQYKDRNTLQAYADVDKVYKYYQDGVPVTELYLKNLVGEFLPDADVTLTPPSGTGLSAFSETTFSVLGEFFVQTPGENYRVGDNVYISTEEGSGFVATVQQTGLAGAVKKINIQNSGINFFSSVTGIVVSANGTNNTAQVLLSPTAITRYPGYYEKNSGKLSSINKIYDGDYYQEFSYKLMSAVSIDKYYAALTKLIHPAGMKMFGSILLENDVSSTASGSTQLTRIGIPVIGNYTPYTNGTTFDLRNNGITATSKGWYVNYGGVTYGTTGDLYPIGYNPYISGAGYTGPSGRTAPLGTTFTAGGSGGKLGYTYCFVPEGGRTAHDPLGAALGGITAWLMSNESRLTPLAVGYSPKNITGLTLWLQPENIGVCGGSLVTGRCMDVWRDSSGSANDAIPPKWDLWTTSPTYTGVTIDKLRPRLVVNDRGIAGRTGIQFNGGVVYGPHTVWLQAGVCGGYPTGKTLGSLPSSVFEWGTGKTGEKILTGQFFTLTRGITLTNDMTAFIVFRAGSTASGYTAENYGLGVVSSSKKFLNFSPAVGSGLTYTGAETDHLFYHRSYKNIDDDSTKTNSTYYFVNSLTNESMYPYETGLVGFRNNTGSTGDSRIAYDPNISTLTGVSLENISLGEWLRQTDGRIQSFYSGDEARNYAVVTARRIARSDSPGGSNINNIVASEVSYNTNPLSMGRFGSYCLPVLDGNYGVSSANWITAAQNNASYSFAGVIYEVLVYDRVLSETERYIVSAYLSKKYQLQEVLPYTYTESAPSTIPLGITLGYWDIAKHPNTAGSSKILSGVSFGNILIEDFIALYGLLYKSAGTKLADGTVLTEDTYEALGE